MRKQKLLDFATTAALAGGSVILLYQNEIAEMVPPKYSVVVVLFLAFLSQIAANSRVKDSKERAFNKGYATCEACQLVDEMMDEREVV